ncbi:hypothetical protein [Azonexus hydrophilus]|uniref:hypothetical protein n=1 Tax=Azonexus hydrophilus TaxID=418702 RepID=UPI001964E239|nr:hypothetical protein [Azonexus hydrophilus]
MIYQAKVLHIDENIEEQVTLQIGNAEITCFAYSPFYEVKLGSIYQVDLELLVLNDYTVEEISEGSEPSLSRTGNTFAYVVTGRVNGRYLKSGELTFKDDVLLSDFGYLDGKMVAMKVDRINADFQPEGCIKTNTLGWVIVKSVRFYGGHSVPEKAPPARTRISPLNPRDYAASFIAG